MANAEAWFSIALRPRKPEGSLGRTAQDGHLDSHTAPELYESCPTARACVQAISFIYLFYFLFFSTSLSIAGNSGRLT